MTERRTEHQPRHTVLRPEFFSALAALAAMFAPGKAVAILISTLCYVAVTLLFFALFRPVNKSLSWLAAFSASSGARSERSAPFTLRLPSPIAWYFLESIAS